MPGERAPAPSPYLRHALEHVGGQDDAGCLQPLTDLRTNAGRTEPSDHLAVGVQAELLETEDLLHGDDVPFHAGDLGDADDLAGAVRQPRLLDDDLDGRGDLLAH